MRAIGELDRRLVLQEPVETDDGAGGMTRTFADVTTLWASVEPVSARFGMVADGAGDAVTHRITIRRGAEISTRHRFVEGARIYQIVAVRDADASRRFRLIEAQERTG